MHMDSISGTVHIFSYNFNYSIISYTYQNEI